MREFTEGSQSCCAIIGGSGFDRLAGFESTVPPVTTPYGMVNDICMGEIAGRCVYFLSRHGARVFVVGRSGSVGSSAKKVAPHKINYRAQLWALKSLGVDKVFAVNAAGAINRGMRPGDLCIPDQIIDYTHGREHTYFDGELSGQSMLGGLDKNYFLQGVHYIDFTEPFSTTLRRTLIAACTEEIEAGHCHPQGTYACTQGPRLETAAEIQRLRGDGCDIVGMTAMPEAALAKELDMSYVSLCALVNYAAGIEAEIPSLEVIMETLEEAADRMRTCIFTAISCINA